MTAKEKAKILIDKFDDIVDENADCDIMQRIIISKQCALLCVDVILQPFLIDYAITEHWQEVRKEIENYGK